MLRSAHSAFQARFQAIEEIEKSSSIGSSPSKDDSNEVIIEEFIQLPGAVIIIAKALQQAPNEVKFDLFVALGLLLETNLKTQKEFRKIDGYMILNDYFNSIFTDCKENIKLLENCFRILTSIALDKKNSQQVSNIHAFRLILHLGATSKNP